MVRLQITMGPEGVRGRANAARTVRPHLASGHRSLQQVSERQNSISQPFPIPLPHDRVKFAAIVNDHTE